MSKTATTHDQAVDQDEFSTVWPGPDARLDDHDDHLACLDSETFALKQAVDQNSDHIGTVQSAVMLLLTFRAADLARIEALETRLAQVESHALTFVETVVALQEIVIRLQDQFGEQVRQLGDVLRVLNDADPVDDADAWKQGG